LGGGSGWGRCRGGRASTPLPTSLPKVAGNFCTCSSVYKCARVCALCVLFVLESTRLSLSFWFCFSQFDSLSCSAVSNQRERAPSWSYALSFPLFAETAAVSFQSFPLPRYFPLNSVRSCSLPLFWFVFYFPCGRAAAHCAISLSHPIEVG